MYAFFSPPFAAVFLWGILFKRINAKGATVAVIAGFIFGIILKVYVATVDNHLAWVAPFANQAALNWAFCSIICFVVSFLTAPPRPEQVTDQLTINWRKINIFKDLGDKWYTSVTLWWLIFVIIIIGLLILFSGIFF